MTMQNEMTKLEIETQQAKIQKQIFSIRCYFKKIKLKIINLGQIYWQRKIFRIISALLNPRLSISDGLMGIQGLNQGSHDSTGSANNPWDFQFATADNMK